VESEASLPEPLVRWVQTLRERGLADLADLFVRLLQLWGFVGGQVLWMLAPLLGQDAIAPIARGLENPQKLDMLSASMSQPVDTTQGTDL
jgi:hypothetical protein